ncbi:serine hydrolase [Myxococcota bacterium]|nr:serine hydrolase [Myxococcota bacterium]
MLSPPRLAALFASSFVATALLFGVVSSATDPVHAAVIAAPAPEWLPPAWVSGPDALAIAALHGHGATRGPLVHSHAALVFDLDQERVLFERRADNRRPVASLTKVVASLAYASVQPDLDQGACIDFEQRPSRSGARSRLNTGDCASGWDYLGAALVASDNRAAYALAAAADLSVDELVTRMNQVSEELGMASSRWADPSGLEDENLSTARDISRAMVALASVPELALAASAPSWDLHRADQAPRRLFTTNKLSGSDRVVIEAAKTGYTDTAGYCLSTLVQTSTGQRLVITLLGAPNDRTRWADVARVVEWAERHDGPGDALADAR